MLRSLQILIVLGIAYCFSLSSVKAISLFLDSETLPAGVWKWNTVWTIIPQYSNAYLDDHQSVPLEQFIIRDEELHPYLLGDFSRSEQQIEFQFTYGLTTDWGLFLSIPWVEKTQTSTLTHTLTSPSSTEEQALANKLDNTLTHLKSKNLSGLGELVLEVQYTHFRSNSLLLQDGVGIRFANADQDSLRGTYDLALGDQQNDIFVFLRLIRYLPQTGWRNGIHLQFTNQLRSERYSLDGSIQGDYDAGNILEMTYYWLLEFNSWLGGIELHRKTQSTATLAGESQNNDLYSHRLNLQLGYTNLSQFVAESAPPWEIRLIYSNLLVGTSTSIPIKNTFANSFWTLQGTWYF